MGCGVQVRDSSGGVRVCVWCGVGIWGWGGMGCGVQVRDSSRGGGGSGSSKRQARGNFQTNKQRKNL